MKKILSLIIISSCTFSAFANTDATAPVYKKFTTTELKAMDCATLAVEKAEAKRSIDAADSNISAAQVQTPGKTISKWAGIASGALTAFGGNSEKVAKANQVAGDLSGEQNASDANNIPLQQQIKATAQANIDNIGIYQTSKKCKI
jgi:hypothetical protein